MADYSNLILHIDEDLVLLDYRLNGSTVNEVMHRARNLVENKLPERLESSPSSVLNKAIQVNKLRKEFLSFVKEHDISEEELRVPFMNYCVRQISGQRFSKLKRKIEQ